jgi:hypothetical protein
VDNIREPTKPDATIDQRNEVALRGHEAGSAAGKTLDHPRARRGSVVREPLRERTASSTEAGSRGRPDSASTSVNKVGSERRQPACGDAAKQAAQLRRGIAVSSRMLT